MDLKSRHELVVNCAENMLRRSFGFGHFWAQLLLLRRKQENYRFGATLISTEPIDLWIKLRVGFESQFKPFAFESVLFFNSFLSPQKHSLIRVRGYFMSMFGSVNNPRTVSPSKWQALQRTVCVQTKWIDKYTKWNLISGYNGMDALQTFAFLRSPWERPARSTH
jgi:hypothetical protein